MKRKTMLFFLIAALLAFTVHAVDTVNVRLDDLGLNVDVPSDCLVYTRNMNPDDPALVEKGIDPEQLQQLMEERSIYLDLLNDDPAYEVLITMMPNVVKNMTVFDEETLESFKAPLTQEYENNGMTVSSIDFFSNDQTIFFRTEGDIAGVKALIYYTICNYQAISFVQRYAGDVMPEEYKTEMQAMVDSVRFDFIDVSSAEDIPGAGTETDVEAAAEAAAEETADEIEAAAEALEEEPTQAGSLITSSADTEDVPASSAKKKGFPVLPVVLGGAAVGAVTGLLVSRGKKKSRAAQQPAYSSQQPIYGAPISPVKPGTPIAPVQPGAAPTYAVPVAPIATTVPGSSASAAAFTGAAAPTAQAATPASPAVPATPIVPAEIPAAPAVPAAASAADIPAPQVPSAFPEKRVCSACGATLTQNEQFCPYCGTKTN